MHEQFCRMQSYRTHARTTSEVCAVFVVIVLGCSQQSQVDRQRPTDGGGAAMRKRAPISDATLADVLRPHVTTITYVAYKESTLDRKLLMDHAPIVKSLHEQIEVG